MAGSVSSDKQCPICLEVIAHDSIAYVHDCMHAYCFTCISKWTKEHTVCPLCRKFVYGIMHNIISEKQYTVDRLCLVGEPFTFTSLNPASRETIAEYRLKCIKEQIREILQANQYTSLHPADRGQMDAVQEQDNNNVVNIQLRD